MAEVEVSIWLSCCRLLVDEVPHYSLSLSSFDSCLFYHVCLNNQWYLSLPNKVWETYCFCSVSYYYFSYYYSYSLSPFFPRTMNLSTADLRNYWTEFHEALWSYRYMFLVISKVFSFVVKGVKVIFWGVQMGWGLLYNPMGKLKFRTLMLITSKWILIET